MHESAYQPSLDGQRVQGVTNLPHAFHGDMSHQVETKAIHMKPVLFCLKGAIDATGLISFVKDSKSIQIQQFKTRNLPPL